MGIFYRRDLISLAKANFYLQPLVSYINGERQINSMSRFVDNMKFSNQGLDFSIDSGVCFMVDNKWNFLIRIPVLQYTYTNQDQLFEFTTNDQIIDRRIHDINLELNLRNIRIGVERLF